MMQWYTPMQNCVTSLTTLKQTVTDKANERYRRGNSTIYGGEFGPDLGL